MRPTRLKLDQIRLDGGTQPRLAIDQAIVEEYAQDLLAGATFPPVDVVCDGAAWWLTDGFHRYFGTQKAGKKTIEAIVRKGTLDEAIWQSLGANKSHGLRRSNADKVNAVQRALAAHPEMSDRAIAEHVGVSDRMVNQHRKLTANGSQSDERTGRDGRTINTANIGKPAEPAPPVDDDAPPAVPFADDAADTMPSESGGAAWRNQGLVSVVGNPVAAVCAKELGLTNAGQFYDWFDEDGTEGIKATLAKHRITPAQTERAIVAVLELVPPPPEAPPETDDDDAPPDSSPEPPAQPGDSPPDAAAADPIGEEIGLTDCLGQQLHGQKLREAFARRAELTRMAHQVSTIKTAIVKGITDKDPLFGHFNATQVAADANNLHRAIRYAMPYAICPWCGGTGCKTCHDQGWITEMQHQQAPAELKGVGRG